MSTNQRSAEFRGLSRGADYLAKRVQRVALDFENELMSLQTDIEGGVSEKLGVDLPTAKRLFLTAIVVGGTMAGALGGTAVVLGAYFVNLSGGQTSESGDMDNNAISATPTTTATREKYAVAVPSNTPITVATPTVDKPSATQTRVGPPDKSPSVGSPPPKDGLPPNEHVLSPEIKFSAGIQTQNLNCEATGTVAMLRTAGYDNITVPQLMDVLIKMGDGNPYHGFVGNPDGPINSVGDDGYGVYPSAIVDALAKFGIKAEEKEGATLADISAQLKLGRPVLAIASWGLPDVPQPAKTWKAKDGSLVQGIPGEHSYVIFGETEHFYHVYNSQPSSAHPITQWVPKDQFNKTFKSFGSQILSIPRKGGSN